MLELKAKCARCGVSEIALMVKKIERRKVGKEPRSFHEYEDLHYREWEIETAAEHGVIEPRVLDVDDEYRYETFCICQVCKKSTTFILKPWKTSKATPEPDVLEKHTGSIHDYLEVVEQVSGHHFVAYRSPENLPWKIMTAFAEGVMCLQCACPNAAGAMFRACVDLATRDATMLSKFLGEDVEKLGLNNTTMLLGKRLEKIRRTGRFPEKLHKLSMCIKEDGNDGVHRVNLDKDAAERLHVFADELLKECYPKPTNQQPLKDKLKLADEQRKKRNL